MTKRARYSYIDLLRVFSVLLVIVLHGIGGYYTDIGHVGRRFWYLVGYANELCRTGVPLFFMMSGFLLLRKPIENIGAFYKHRFLKIAAPFLLYDIFYYVFLTSGKHSVGDFIADLCVSGSAYHLWFIYSILALYLLAPFISRLLAACDEKAVFVFFLLAIAQTTLKPFLNLLCGERLWIYFTDDGIVGYLGYMILGYALGKFELPKKARVAICLLGVLSFAVTPLFSAKQLASGETPFFNGGYTLNHYIEAAALFLAAKKFFTVDRKFITRLSVLSMDTYFIHVFFLEKLRFFGDGCTPFFKMAIQIGGTIVLSFLYAYLKDAAVKSATRFLHKKSAE